MSTTVRKVASRGPKAGNARKSAASLGSRVDEARAAQEAELDRLMAAIDAGLDEIERLQGRRSAEAA